jgi:hypothetical protein
MNSPGKFLRWLKFGGWMERVEGAEVEKSTLRPGIAGVLLFACAVCFLSLMGYCDLSGVTRKLGVGRYLVAVASLLCGGLVVLGMTVTEQSKRRRYMGAYLAFGLLLVLFCVAMESLLPGRRMAHLALAGVTALAGQIWFWRVAVAATRAQNKRTSTDFRVHGGKIALDLMKTVLLIVLLQLVTLPFRPLALEPPPADLIARYVPPEAEPMGDGAADRLLREIAPWAYPTATATNANTTDWSERWERFFEKTQRGALPLRDKLRMNRWQWLVGSDTDAELDVLLTNAVAFADACINESPRPRQMEENPLVVISPGYWPPFRLLRLDTIRQVDRNVPATARKSIGRLLDVGVYGSRGRATDWRFGVHAVRHATWGTLRLAESKGGLPVAEALALDREWQSAGERFSRSTVALRRDGLGPVGRARATFFHQPEIRRRIRGVAFGSEEPFSKLQKDARCSSSHPFVTLSNLAEHSALMGNPERAVAKVSENVAMWSVVRVGALLDPQGPSLAELDTAESAVRTGSRRGSLWSRGWVAPPMWHFRDEYARDQSRLWSDCLTARTATMLAAYRAETGNDADTLDDVAERFDWTIPEHPVTEQPLDYIRLAAPTNATPGADGYALASWADGRAILEGGGRVWLVVRNPAFGDLPSRIYTWYDSGGGEGTLTNTVQVSEAEVAHFRVRQRLPALQVPASLFGPDPKGWSMAGRAMSNAGWRED